MGLTFKMAAPRFAGVVRQFSTSAPRSHLVAAPIQIFGLEGRYAHALYSAASKEKKLDAVEKELNGFTALMGKDVKLAEYVNNPTVNKLEKRDALVGVLKKQNASNLTTNLVGAMAENGRLKSLGGVIGAFGKIMAAERGEILCTVTTAKALDASSLKEVKAAMQGFVSKGQVLQIETKVDPSIIAWLLTLENSTLTCPWQARLKHTPVSS